MITYTGNFKAGDGTLYQVQIVTAETGTAQTLELGVPPFVVTYAGGDILQKPMKLSGATITLLVSSYISGFMVSSHRAAKVTLTDTTHSVVKWRGYLTPNVYSQPYDGVLDSMEVEAVDQLAALEYVMFDEMNDSPGVATLRKVVNDILAYTDYSYIYVTKNLHIATGACILDEVLVNETLFSGWTLKKVFEEICSYLNVTAVAYDDVVYMIDYDALAAGYWKSTIGSTSKTTQASSSVKTLAGMITAAGATISAKKVLKSVRLTSKFGTLPCITDEAWDEDGLTNNAGDWTLLKYYGVDLDSADAATYTALQMWLIGNHDRLFWIRYLSSPMVTCFKGTAQAQWNPTELTTDIGGRMAEQSYAYDAAGVSKVTDSFKGFVVINHGNNGGPYKAVAIKSAKPQIVGGYSGSVYTGYFDLSGSLAILRKSKNRLYVDAAAEGSGSWSDLANARIFAALRVGSQYYNGSLWTATPSTFAVAIEADGDTKKYDLFTKIKSTERYNVKAAGMLIPAADVSRTQQKAILAGDIELTLYTYKDTSASSTNDIEGYIVKDLSLRYVRVINSTKKDETDVEYYNVIDSANEETLELQQSISSYQKKVPCNNTPLVQIQSGVFRYLDAADVYKDSESEHALPEEFKVAALCEQYGTNTLVMETHADAVGPADRCTFTALPGKTMVVDKMVIDYYDESNNQITLEEKK